MSLVEGGGALVLWMDISPDLEREVDAWYIDEHLPERIDIGGYDLARRYAAVAGQPAYMSMFGAKTPDALASEGYLRLVSQVSDNSKRIRAAFSNVVRNTFVVRRSLGRGTGAVIGSLRLSILDDAAREPSCAALDEVAAELSRRQGIVGSMRLEAAPAIRRRMDASRMTGLADASADHVLLVEGTRAADVAAAFEQLTERLTGMGWQADGFGIYGLLYEVRQLG